jgi:hypothetical protein
MMHRTAAITRINPRGDMLPRRNPRGIKILTITTVSTGLQAITRQKRGVQWVTDADITLVERGYNA